MVPTHVQILEVFAFHEPCAGSAGILPASRGMVRTRREDAGAPRLKVPMRVQNWKWRLPMNAVPTGAQGRRWLCLTALLALCLTGPLSAQHADSFNPDCDGRVFASALQEDGQILIGGEFTSVGGVARPKLARLHVDGRLDVTFHPDLDDSVYTVAVQPDGKILAGGSFLQVNGELRANIARLDPDGSLDRRFSAQAGGPVLQITLLRNHRLLVAGGFSPGAGQPQAG